MSEPSTKRELPVVRGSASNPQGRDTFCVYAWKILQVNRDTTAAPCCTYDGAIVDARGSAMSIQDRSLDEIWNSDDMRRMRRAMVEGKPVGGCVKCY